MMNVSPIDKETTQAVRDFSESARAEQTGQRYGEYMGGAENTAQGLLRPANDNFENQLSGGQPNPMLDAVRSKSNQSYSRELARLKHETKLNSQGDHLKKLETATQLAGEEARINHEKAIMRDKIRRARRAARGQILGSVLGIAGGIAGGVMGSVAGGVGAGAGAMAGYQLGSGVGQAVGGS